MIIFIIGFSADCLINHLGHWFLCWGQESRGWRDGKVLSKGFVAAGNFKFWQLQSAVSISAFLFTPRKSHSDHLHEFICGQTINADFQAGVCEDNICPFTLHWKVFVHICTISAHHLLYFVDLDPHDCPFYQNSFKVKLLCNTLKGDPVCKNHAQVNVE